MTTPHKKTLFWVLPVLVACLLLCWWLLAPSLHAFQAGSPSQQTLAAASAQTAIKRAPQTATLPPDAKRAAFARYASLGAKLGVPAASLAGTQVDGAVAAGPDDQLLLGAGIHQLFDYFLSSLGEENLDTIQQRIAYYLQQNLPATAALQAWDLWGRYLHYRHSLAQIPAANANPTELAHTLAARNALRRNLLGTAASQAFWGPEQAYDDYVVKTLHIRHSQSLNAAQKRQRLAALKAGLPSDVNKMLTATMAPTNLSREVARKRQLGVDEAQIDQLREDAFGAAAVARFDKLDARRAHWKKTYGHYRQQRQAIVAAGLTAADQQRQIKALRQRLFAANQLKRVAALDTIAAVKAAGSNGQGKADEQ